MYSHLSVWSPAFCPLGLLSLRTRVIATALNTVAQFCSHSNSHPQAAFYGYLTNRTNLLKYRTAGTCILLKWNVTCWHQGNRLHESVVMVTTEWRHFRSLGHVANSYNFCQGTLDVTIHSLLGVLLWQLKT